MLPILARVFQLRNFYTYIWQTHTVRPDTLEPMQQLAIQAAVIDPQQDEDFETGKAAAIAKCQRRIEAARHLYEDGDLSRQEYLRRRDHNECEIIHWQTYSTEKLSDEIYVFGVGIHNICTLESVSKDIIEDRVLISD